MGNAADTLVSKNPTRIAQLRGPVLSYLVRESKSSRGLYSYSPQDLYMAVFYPPARKWSSGTDIAGKIAANPKLGGKKTAALFTKQNPGIKTVGDYINKVEYASKIYNPLLTKTDRKALDETASALDVSPDILYKLINFESEWDPKARNPASGARGLIQFMPSTAKGMGYKATLGMGTLLLFLGVGYFAVKKMKLL